MAEPGGPVRAHLDIHGRVQGVWFRGSMQHEAERLGVAGWARNRPGGTVEAEVEGTRGAVDALIAWAHHGPRGARVTEVQVRWTEPRGERDEFAVRT
jgi:acylphosphatase